MAILIGHRNGKWERKYCKQRIVDGVVINFQRNIWSIVQNVQDLFLKGMPRARLEPKLDRF